MQVVSLHPRNLFHFGETVSPKGAMSIKINEKIDVFFLVCFFGELPLLKFK